MAGPFGMFGRRNISGPIDPGMSMPGQDAPQQAAPSPFKLDTMSKLGLVGDILTGAPVTQSRLHPQQEFALQQMQAQAAQRQKMLAPQTIGNNIVRLNQQTGQYETVFSAPAAPHYFETNDGSQGVIGPDGKPQILYKDPTPKTQWITADDGMGGKSIIPIVNGVPNMGGSMGGSRPAGPPAGVTFTPLPVTGGASPSGSRRFP